MARTTLLLSAVAALALATVGDARVAAPAQPAPAAIPTAPTFAISGRGWGHGVGMSQWGAYGFAQRGFDYARIVGHYYRGTTLGRAPVTRVRVLVLDGRKTVTISSDRPFVVRDALGEEWELEARAYGFGSGFRINVDGSGPQALEGPLTFSPTNGAMLKLNGKRYRGSFEAVAERSRLRVVNVVGLEAYLYGVVPDEVPHHWPAEALKAQAVVARTYALAVRRNGLFDLYDDTRSQVYNGVDAEELPTTAAVNATAGQVLLYGGQPARTYFFSTSGGRTANVLDVWGGSVPYLISVLDPYDSASPHHAWGPYTFTPARLVRAIGVKGRLLDVRTVVNGSARVERLVGVGTGGEASISGTDARQKLGLRSTWFRVGVLALDRPRGPVVHGSRLTMGGVARALPGVMLEQRAVAGTWARVAAVTAGPDGRFSHVVKPVATTEFRLVSGSARSASVRVAVAAFVRLLPPQDATALRGTVRPAVAGKAVAVQRRTPTGWRRVAQAVVDDGGAFEAALQLTPGTYRAAYAPGGGLVPGTSATLDVVP